jgi:hypothetical protein
MGAGVPLWGGGDTYWYRATVGNSYLLRVLLTGSDPYYDYALRVHQGSMTGTQVGTRSQSGNEQSVDVPSPAPGDYYIEVQNVAPGPRTFDLQVDYNNPPAVSIVSPSPPPGGSVRGAVLVEAQASDDVGIARVDFFVDGGYKSSDTTEPYQMMWDTCPSAVSEGPHTICAKAWDVCGKTAQACINVTVDNTTFDDVPKTSSQWSCIEALVTNGITGGCAPALYCPYNNVTRAQMACFLCRAAGKGPLNPDVPTFADVPKTNMYYGCIERLADSASWCMGAPTSGCRLVGTAKYFCPWDPVTREQMAKFLCLAACKSPMPSCSGKFCDVPFSNPFCTVIERLSDGPSWCGGVAVTSGCACPSGYAPGCKCYCPKSNITRGEMAVFLVRAFCLLTCT